MWRRWTNNKEPHIGNPTLFDTTVDEGYLETIPEVDSLRSRASTVSTALPELPFRPVPPLQSSQTSKRTSSIYSEQPPDIAGENGDKPSRHFSINSGVSSVSTPHSSVDDLPISPIVSPVESSTDWPNHHTPTQSQFKSHIPRRKVVDTVEESSRPVAPVLDRKRGTRWDDYSGEPSDNGKPATVAPGSAPLVAQFPQLKERTKQILADLKGKRDSAAPGHRAAWEKTSPPAAADPLDHPVHKEPWKGASGRTAIVDPVQNTPSARLHPLRIPKNNHIHENTNTRSNPTPGPRPAPVHEMTPAQANDMMSAATATPESIYRAEPMSAPATSMQSAPPPTDASFGPLTAVPRATSHEPMSAPINRSSEWPDTPTIRPVASQDNIKPIAPLKVSKTPRVTSTATVEDPGNMQFASSNMQAFTENSIHDVVTTPRTPQHRMESPEPMGDPATPTPFYGYEPQQKHHSLNTQPVKMSHDTKSHFSWSTYATSADDSPRSVRQGTHNGSPAPPLPTMSPLVIKKRPVSQALFSTLSTTIPNSSLLGRKALANGGSRSASLITTASLSKSLPQCPPELEAEDKISSLEARMDDLARRKVNLHKIVKELLGSMKRNSITYDSRKRKEYEKMITNMNLELQEVTQEEHEVGLRLHRAQRKRDRDDNYEQPTGLWIKRVTS